MIEFLKGLTQLHNLFYSVLWFVVILTVLVFVHEFGHYIIARWNRVRIEVFSIGFGPELFGWWDRAGTRWKFSAIPLGGYVKMFGDSDASSGLPAPGLSRLSEVERGVSFHYKRLGQRAAIVAAGPAANFIFAIVALAVLFMTYGQPFTPAEVGQVQPGSAAEQGGIHPGDVIVPDRRSGRSSFRGRAAGGTPQSECADDDRRAARRPGADPACDAEPDGAYRPLRQSL